jgi:hypothetical protein
MSYVADVKEQLLQGKCQLNNIAHIYTVTKPQNRLNVNKGRCNIKVFRIDLKEGICNGFPKKAF